MTPRERRLLTAAIVILPRLVGALLLVILAGLFGWLLVGCASLLGFRHA